MRRLADALQLGKESIRKRPFAVRAGVCSHLGLHLVEPHQLAAEFAERGLLRAYIFSRTAGAVKAVLCVLCHGKKVADLFLHGVDAKTLQRAGYKFAVTRLLPEVIPQHQKIRRCDFRMSLQPRLCLRNGEVAEEFSVGHRNLCAQRTEHIVHQVVDAVRNFDGRDFLLHGVQLLQRDRRMDCAERAAELVFQDRKSM